MNLTPKSTLLDAIKSGYGLYGMGWCIIAIYGKIFGFVEQVDTRKELVGPKVAEVSTKGLEEVLAWVAEHSAFEVQK